jgi:hypothetical protein
LRPAGYLRIIFSDDAWLVEVSLEFFFHQGTDIKAGDERPHDLKFVGVHPRRSPRSEQRLDTHGTQGGKGFRR